MVLNLNGKRGRRVLYSWNGRDMSITDLLKEQDIRTFIGRGTYASQREKLRKLLKQDKINPKLVSEYVAQNSTTP